MGAAGKSDLEGAMKVLVIDDAVIDVELTMMELRRAGVAAEYVVATDEVELRTALAKFEPHVILCDFEFPDFDGFAAQRIAREAYPDAPLIFLSGTITEHQAVTALQSGAVDYVLKSNLLRLPSAVQRAVREAADRTRLERSLESSESRALRQSERLEALWRVVNTADLRGAKLLRAMLHQSAAMLRPDLRFWGILGRVAGHEMIIVDVAAEAEEDGGSRARLLRVGNRVAIGPPSGPHAMGQTGSTAVGAAHVPAGLKALGWRTAVSTEFDADGVRYSLSYAATAESAPLSPEDFSYLGVVTASFANQLRVVRLENSLRDEEERSRQHAERLEALWRRVNDPSLRDDALWLALLSQAAAAIEPGQPYWGALWRVDTGDLVLQASSEVPPGLHVVNDVGSSVALEATNIPAILAGGGGTRSWDDVQSGTSATARARASDTHALILSTFTGGGAAWCLAFSSPEPAKRPLGTQVHAYIEVLASYFANHVHQRWQFDRLRYQESHDVLTGLLNRSQFRAEAGAASHIYGRYGIVLLDINAFHEINESYGAAVADALLVEVARDLQLRRSGDEIVARIGPDVFGIYIPNPPSKEFVRIRALDFAGVFAHSFTTGDAQNRSVIARSASIGVAVAPFDGPEIDAVLSRADAALLTAKAHGHGWMTFYEVGMEGNSQRRAAFHNELTAAITSDQFTLHYQPHVEISSGAVTGCEALVRWNHPERGLLLPGHFIPFAEQTGMITRIDDWVMVHAFAASKELSGMPPGFRLYFNLSGRQAGDSKLVRAFVHAARSGVDLSRLGVEITESDAMRDIEATRRVCRALRRLNVRIAIDDFGTGYSSLSFLKRLPVDIVKIDRSFISGILTNSNDRMLAETIISITERFGFESLAEGAEHMEEIEWLRQRYCRYVQGYAICHPLPFDDFKAWVAARRETPADQAPVEPIAPHIERRRRTTAAKPVPVAKT